MSLQKALQTDALAWRVSQEFKTEFSSIGTGILKVCKCPEIVTEQWNPRGGGGTLIFSAYVGSDPASTVQPKKISGISNTPKKYLKF